MPNNCKNCGNSAEIGRELCANCVNNWLTIRGVIQARLQEKHGAPTRETLPIITEEFKRLDALWKRDRPAFEKELNTWFPVEA